MKKNIIKILLVLFAFCSCESDFFEPSQSAVVFEDDYFKVWSDFESYQLGIYRLQQELADQLMVLGEVRGDMVSLTDNANRDLVELYNFDVSRNNIYTQPDMFYNLIGSCNELLSRILKKSPGVLDPKASVDNYDLLYGEMQCMLAWAYFNASKVWKEVPYIPIAVNSVAKVNAYINTGSLLIDSTNIHFDFGALYNDSLSVSHVDSIHLEKQYLSMDAIIDTFTHRLENLKVDLNGKPAIGVDNSIDAKDETFLVTFWTPLSYYALISQMYLYEGDLYKAKATINKVNETVDDLKLMDEKNSFSSDNWKNIFTGLDRTENIMSIWYNKSYKQTNDFQYLFSNEGINSYQLKPSRYAVRLYESEFFGSQWRYDNSTGEKKMIIDGRGDPILGRPGDFYRGYGVTYAYFKDGLMMSPAAVHEVLDLKQDGEFRQIKEIMDGVDTVVYKYSLGKGIYDRDAYYPLYRGASLSLYMAEIYASIDIIKNGSTGIFSGSLRIAEGYLNDEVSFFISNGEQVFGINGVRGRVYPTKGASGGYVPIEVSLVNAIHDSDNNEIIGYERFSQGDKRLQQEYILDKMLDERGREMAYEGDRFYDLLRLAKKTNNFKKFIADRVAVGNRSHLHSRLMLEDNCYLPWFD